MNTTTPAAAATLAANLNEWAGSSASGLYVIANLNTGEIFPQLWAAGSRPRRLYAGQAMIQIGRKFTADDFLDDL